MTLFACSYNPVFANRCPNGIRSGSKGSSTLKVWMQNKFSLCGDGYSHCGPIKARYICKVDISKSQIVKCSITTLTQGFIARKYMRLLYLMLSISSFLMECRRVHLWSDSMACAKSGRFCRFHIVFQYSLWNNKACIDVRMLSTAYKVFGYQFEGFLYSIASQCLWHVYNEFFARHFLNPRSFTTDIWEEEH